MTLILIFLMCNVTAMAVDPAFDSSLRVRILIFLCLLFSLFKQLGDIENARIVRKRKKKKSQESEPESV